MKDFMIQYFDADGELKVAHIKAHDKDEAIDKFWAIIEKGGGQP